MRKYFFFFVIVLFIANIPSQLVAQTDPVYKSNYRLFWKIEGDSLTKPSYLFGTMHVQDKRCFEFTDDMLQSLFDADILALELDFDSVYQKMVSMSIDDATKQRFFEDFFDEEEMEVIEEEATKKGINLRLLPRKDIRTLDYYLDKPSADEAEKMPIFLDAYLFYLAKSYDKKVLGLEKYEDQIQLYEQLPDEITKEAVLAKFKEVADGVHVYDRMLSIYQSGDIDEIDEFMSLYSDEYREKLIVERNKNMVDAAVPLIQDNSVFIAVGAAHLPGSNGIIELLKKKGYTLTLMPVVFSSIADSLLDIGIKPNSWEQFDDSLRGFSVNVPFKPMNYEKFGGALDMKICMDFIQGPYYYFYGVPTAMAGLEEGNDDFIDILANRFEEMVSGQVVSKKSINYRGVRGAEITIKTHIGFEYKTKVFLVNKHMYLLMVGNTKKDYNSEDATQFYNSLRFYQPEIIKSEASDWKEYKIDLGAFSVKLPAEPNYQKMEAQNPNSKDGEEYSIHMYYGLDILDERIYFIQWYDLPSGYIYENDSDVFQQFFTSLIGEDFVFDPSKMDAVSKLGSYGYESPQIIENRGIKFKFQVFLRGNRTYLLMAQIKGQEEQNDDIDAFFSSFKTIPFIRGKYARHSVKLLETNLPDNPSFIEEDNIYPYFSDGFESSTYSCIDKNCGVSYVVVETEYPKYYRIHHADSFLLELRTSIMAYGDKLIDSSAGRTKQNYSFVAGVIKSEYSSNRTRFMLILNENRVYELYAYVTEEMQTDSLVDLVFNQVEMDDFVAEFDMFTSKSSLIFSDLMSSDSSTFANANTAFDYYEFDSTDLNLLHSALSNVYPDSAETYNGAKQNIIYELSILHNDSTLFYVLDCYKKDFHLHGGDLLGLMNKLSKNNPAILFDQLKEHLPDELYFYEAREILNPIVDSSLFCVNNFDDILLVSNQKQYLQNSFLFLFFDNWADLSLNEDQQKILASYGDKWFDIALDSINNYPKDSWQVYNFTSLLSNIIKVYSKLPNTNYKLLKSKLKGLDFEEIRSALIHYKLGHELKISNKEWKESLEDEYYGFELISEISTQQMLHLVPASYKTPDHIAKMTLIDYFSYDDYFPYAMEYAETRTISIDDKEVVFYIFDCSWEGDSEKFISISGAFDIQEKNIDLENYWVDNDYIGFTEQKDREISIQKLLKSAKKYLEKDSK